MRLLVASGIGIWLAAFSGASDPVRDVYAGPCGIHVLPRGPRGLPAPVEIWTKCGTFLVDSNGTVTHEKKPGPRPWYQAGDRRPPPLKLGPARLKPRRIAWDSGVVPSSSGELAFTATEGYTGRVRPGYETIYVLRPGSRRPRALFSHRVVFSLCGRGVQLWWRGRWLLYAAGEGHVIAFDTAGANVVDLTSTLRRLPGTRATSHVYRLHTASWA
jgi:hypothetical protein